MELSVGAACVAADAIDPAATAQMALIISLIGKGSHGAADPAGYDLRPAVPNL
jgi:hypothetical protein